METKLSWSFPWFSPDRDERVRRLDVIADAGIRKLVLPGEFLQWSLFDPRYFLESMAEFRERALIPHDAHAVWGDWSDPALPVETFRPWMIARHAALLAMLGGEGVKTLTFHAGNTYPQIYGEYPLEHYRRMLTASLEVLLPEAERYNVVLALENSWTPLCHSRHLVDIAGAFHSPWLGLCYDSGHGHLMEQGRELPNIVPEYWQMIGAEVEWEAGLIEKFRPLLVTCHLHDNHGVTDSHLLPGQGSVDWGRIRRNLADAPRLISIQTETAMPEVTAERAVELKKCFETLFL
ncbi:MAG: sugar phosphate isomerase/epimerase [Lentisphaeria bacterium]|nr:sugar phosphate isomerase/epimerase [Lentisphaeria bacterium]